MIAVRSPESGSVVQCAIALGSNLGDSLAILAGAIVALNAMPEIQVGAVSPWFRTAPIGPPQPDYINGCAILATSLEPLDLLDALLLVEAQFGRERRERWGARTLDLDLLLYGDRMIDLPRLTVPHPRMAERGFVLLPLVEIAADWVDPRSGLTIRGLANLVDGSGVAHI
jgi:2-amino-4-hydroxy-6-hydroxymethyldihydropteridine diphosphokinase